MKLFVLFFATFAVGCTTTADFKKISDNLPGEGLYTVKVGERECIIAENEDEQLVMQCFEPQKNNLTHEVLIKRAAQ